MKIFISQKVMDDSFLDIRNIYDRYGVIIGKAFILHIYFIDDFFQINFSVVETTDGCTCNFNIDGHYYVSRRSTDDFTRPIVTRCAYANGPVGSNIEAKCEHYFKHIVTNLKTMKFKDVALELFNILKSFNGIFTDTAEFLGKKTNFSATFSRMELYNVLSQRSN